jgi:hypothetical protein
MEVKDETDWPHRLKRRPLNFIWRRATLDFVLEAYFIREILLGTIGRPVRVFPFEDNQRVAIGPDTLLASLGTQAAPLLRDARQRGVTNVGLFHMGDEEGKDDRAFYADAAYVVRNYWWPDAMTERVIWVPNGYRTGLGPLDPARHLTIAERGVFGFFSGATTGRLLIGQREAMLQVVSKAKLPFSILQTSGFGQGLGPVAYTAWLCNSRFALVPAGNSHETIRLYDALEAGAIPIMVRSPFVSARDALGARGEPPIILLDSWDQLPDAIGPYVAADDSALNTLEQRRQAIMSWWCAFKSEQQNKTRDLITRAFHDMEARV